MPQFENRQNVQLTCHTRDEGEGENVNEYEEREQEGNEDNTTLKRTSLSTTRVGEQLVRLQGGKPSAVCATC